MSPLVAAIGNIGMSSDAAMVTTATIHYPLSFWLDPIDAFRSHLSMMFLPLEYFFFMVRIFLNVKFGSKDSLDLEDPIRFSVVFVKPFR